MITGLEVNLFTVDGVRLLTVSPVKHVTVHKKVKMLRFETNGWCMYYVRMLEGGFRWNHSADPSAPLLTAERRQLLWLLEGLDFEQAKAPRPVAAHGIL